jgi:hypothetical protein
MFDYVSEEDLAPKQANLTPGEASFKVGAIFDTKKDGSPLTTMDGTPKLTVSMWVIDCDGNQGNVYDDLTQKTAWKIKALLDAVNLSHLYDPSGMFNPDELKDCVGKCVIELKKSEGYADRISVKKYLKPKVQAAKVDASQVLDELNDQIPF